MAKFLAALSVFSPSGGLLATVYSTGLDRAVELVKATKQYLNWMLEPSGTLAGYETIHYARDNERSYTLVTPSGVKNEVSARPRNVESCRGDAPRAAFFDEAAFMTAHFWWGFAYPLLQVKNRIFTCTTTPPPSDNYFADFSARVKEANLKGDTFFYLVNHALACPVSDATVFSTAIWNCRFFAKSCVARIACFFVSASTCFDASSVFKDATAAFTTIVLALSGSLVSNVDSIVCFLNEH